MATDMQNVTTEMLSIGDLLSSRVPFNVPPYQRTYAWTRDELGDFVTDMLDIYRTEVAGASVGQSTDHFFGGLVSVQYEVQTKIGHRYELVDGQQRMTTFFMVLKIIEGHLRRIADKATDGLAHDALESAKFIHSDFLTYKDRAGGQNKWTTAYRLTLSRADSRFFIDLLDGKAPESDSASHDRLTYAWKYLDRELIKKGVFANEKLAIEEQFVRLSDLQVAVTERAFAIHVRSSQRKQAYRLFQVLNDRGRALTDGDLLRARTLELLEGFTVEQSDCVTAWDEVLSDTDSITSRFLRDYYGSIVGRRAPRRDLFDSFMTDIFGYGERDTAADAASAGALSAKIRFLPAAWQLHGKLMAAFWPYEQHRSTTWERERLVWLVDVLAQDGAVPLLLAAAGAEEADFARLVSFLDRFVFRHRVAGEGHPSRTQDVYFKHAREIGRADDKSAAISEAIGSLRAVAAKETPEDVFRLRLGALRYRPGGKNTDIRYFLATINDHLAWLRGGAHGAPRPDKSASSDPHHLDVEHIAPQSSDGDLIHSLGNLTFWSPSDNRSAQDDPFRMKRDAYSKSKSQLTAELATCSDWTDADIIAREAELIDWAVDLFDM